MTPARQWSRVFEAADGPDDLQAMVDGLAAQLQRSVAIDDRHLQLLVASRHFGDEDGYRIHSVLNRELDADLRRSVLDQGIQRFRGPTRIGGRGEFGWKPRLCVPVRSRGVLLGFLWLIDDGSMTVTDVRRAASIADAAGLLLYRRAASTGERQRQRAPMFRALLSADDATRMRAARTMAESGEVEDCAEVAVAVVRSRPAHGTNGATADHAGNAPEHGIDGSLLLDAASLQVCLELRPAAEDVSVCALPSSRGVTVVFTGALRIRSSALRLVVRRVIDAMSELTGHGFVAGVGDVHRGTENAHASLVQAESALRTASVFVPELEVASWDDLSDFALIHALTVTPLSPAAYPAWLTDLACARNADALIETAESYLDLAGDARATANALHVHRATLYQRIARVEQVTGLQLRNGLDRLNLHLALKLLRLDGGVERLLSSGDAPGAPDQHAERHSSSSSWQTVDDCR